MVADSQDLKLNGLWLLGFSAETAKATILGGGMRLGSEKVAVLAFATSRRGEYQALPFRLRRQHVRCTPDCWRPIASLNLAALGQ
jgi:hypothetical protein